jgi:hypothetical protein
LDGSGVPVNNHASAIPHIPVTIAWLPDVVNPALASAVETSVCLVVYGGGAPPLAIVQVARAVVGVQVVGAAGLVVATRVSLASSPVSIVSMNRLFESLLYVPEKLVVTVMAIVHVPKPATVMFVNDKAVCPTVNVAGDGAGTVPQLVYVTVVLATLIC